MLGLIGGYMRGLIADEIVSRVMEAHAGDPVILMGLLVITNFGTSRWPMILTCAFLFTPIVFRTVRAVDARRGRARLRHVGHAARRAIRCSSMTREILPNITGPIVVELTVRVGYAIFTIATLVFVIGGGDPGSPEWGNQVSRRTRLIPGGTWWPTVFPALALASLVIAVNLIADSVEAVYAS